MDKKILLSLSALIIALGGCQSKSSEKETLGDGKRNIVYKKEYQNPPSELSQIGNPENLDTVTVYEKPKGQVFHDTFTKETGRAESSDFEPATF